MLVKRNIELCDAASMLLHMKLDRVDSGLESRVKILAAILLANSGMASTSRTGGGSTATRNLRSPRSATLAYLEQRQCRTILRTAEWFQVFADVYHTF
ncbi:hypothetical protein PsorP6_006379 [Peronosclerospora sorghi]|uniref:Uncharacterized protein n=1 Tax=Peronosclerospora sorghi TaxID=230839 RepID=A0ACC0W3B8_9STRA|nr:hypothetical protein PsorP6_006379 [Peronosclerospora sorghi]